MMHQILYKAIDKSILFIGYFTAFILVCLVLLVVYDASARYFFSFGLVSLQELEWHLYNIVILMGISFALKYKLHVRVDIFYESYSLNKKSLVNLISSIFFIFPFSLLIIYVSIGFVEMSYIQNESSSNAGGLEYRYLIKAVLPLSFAFVILQLIKDILDDFKIWKTS